MNRIRVPEQDRPTIFKLLKLDDNDSEQLLKALREAKPALRFNVLSARVASQLNRLEAGEVRKIVQLLLTLRNVNLDFDGATSVFIDELLSDLSSDDDEFVKDDLPKYKARLATYLDLDEALGVVSKAQRVMADHDRVYCKSGIVTDIRPIFSDDDDVTPLAAVTVHILNIGYHQDGDHHEFHVALDSADIKALRSVLDRAEKKDAQLQSMLKKCDVEYLNVEDRE